MESSGYEGTRADGSKRRKPINAAKFKGKVIANCNGKRPIVLAREASENKKQMFMVYE